MRRATSSGQRTVGICRRSNLSFAAQISPFKNLLGRDRSEKCGSHPQPDWAAIWRLPGPVAFGHLPVYNQVPEDWQYPHVFVQPRFDRLFVECPKVGRGADIQCRPERSGCAVHRLAEVVVGEDLEFVTGAKNANHPINGCD